MKVAVAVLNYKQPITQAEAFLLVPEGYDRFCTIDQKGIGRACNRALDWAFNNGDSDYLLIMANDIREPKNGIEMRMNAIANTEGEVGICVIPCDRQSKRESVWVASNYMISRKLWEKIGYFTEQWDKTYGPIDLNYSTRSYLAGFKNINVLGAKAEHLDNGDTAYGFSKREKLNTSMKEFRNWYNNIIQHPNPKLYLEP